jgi:hypothetical protein
MSALWYGASGEKLRISPDKIYFSALYIQAILMEEKSGIIVVTSFVSRIGFFIFIRE